MAEVLLLRDKLLRLVPADGLAEEEIGHFPMGRPLRCTLVRARSNPNLRHYWACLHAFSTATGKAPARVLHELLKMECGLVTVVSTSYGGVKLVPDSVAFDKLSEADFIDYKRRAFEALHVNFGVDPATLSREGAELLGKQSSPGGTSVDGEDARRPVSADGNKGGGTARNSGE